MNSSKTIYSPPPTGVTREYKEASCQLTRYLGRPASTNRGPDATKRRCDRGSRCAKQHPLCNPLAFAPSIANTAVRRHLLQGRALPFSNGSCSSVSIYRRFERNPSLTLDAVAAQKNGKVVRKTRAQAALGLSSSNNLTRAEREITQWSCSQPGSPQRKPKILMTDQNGAGTTKPTTRDVAVSFFAG